MTAQQFARLAVYALQRSIEACHAWPTEHRACSWEADPSRSLLTMDPFVKSWVEALNGDFDWVLFDRVTFTCPQCAVLADYIRENTPCTSAPTN